MRVSWQFAFAAVLASGAAVRPVLASTAPPGPALGTYTGTTADGSTVSFGVTEDASTNLPAVTSALIYFTATCPSPHSAVASGLGFGLSSDIKADKASYASGFPTSTYIAFSLTFDPATNSLTGTTETVTATLASTTKVPTKSYVCTSAKQTLSATLQSSSSAAKPAAPASFVYDRHGRVVGSISK